MSSPNTPYDRLDAHFALIQSVVSRQASNSFMVKGWALTASLALFGFSIDNRSDGLAWLGVFAVAFMWSLDGYFLRQERLFRCLYEAAVAEDGSVQLYSMDTSPYNAHTGSRLHQCLSSVTLLLFYVPLAVTGFILGLTFHQV